MLPGRKSFNWAPAFPIDAFMRWNPRRRIGRTIFLNVLKPTLNPAEALPAMEKLKTEREFGA